MRKRPSRFARCNKLLRSWINCRVFHERFKSVVGVRFTESLQVLDEPVWRRRLRAEKSIDVYYQRKERSLTAGVVGSAVASTAPGIFAGADIAAAAGDGGGGIPARFRGAVDADRECVPATGLPALGRFEIWAALSFAR